MSKIIVKTREGEEHHLEIKPGFSLMELIREAGIDELEAICGGCCSCATCHVHVAEHFFGQLPEIEEDEDDLLEMSDHRNEFSRLSCQIEVSDALSGMSVQIAEED